MIAYRSEKLRLDAISRLRSGLPEDTVIYARHVSGQPVTPRDLIDAGATDVVSERTEAAIQFARLVGAVDSDGEDCGMIRQMLTISESDGTSLSTRNTAIPGVTRSLLIDMAEEFECSPGCWICE